MVKFGLNARFAEQLTTNPVEELKPEPLKIDAAQHISDGINAINRGCQPHPEQLTAIVIWLMGRIDEIEAKLKSNRTPEQMKHDKIFNRRATARPTEERAMLNDLLARFADREETICSAELCLLRRIAETSSDMVKARNWEEFRVVCGSQEKLDKAHEDAVYKYDQWLSNGEG